MTVIEAKGRLGNEARRDGESRRARSSGAAMDDSGSTEAKASPYAGITQFRFEGPPHPTVALSAGLHPAPLFRHRPDIVERRLYLLVYAFRSGIVAPARPHGQRDGQACFVLAER